MAKKSQILDCLTKDYLNDIAKEHGIAGAYRINRKFLISILSRKRSVNIKEILNDLSLADLKMICQGVGVDDTGRKGSSANRAEQPMPFGFY